MIEPNPSRHLIYEFGSFRLDRSELMLYRDGTEVPLPPKAVETLLALVERRGQIVTKDDLMKAIWSDTIVEETNLSRYIYVLRSMLGEQSNGTPYIQTFRRRGYRFNSEVDVIRPAASVTTVRDFPHARVGGSAVKEGTTGNVIAVADWQRAVPGIEEDAVLESDHGRVSVEKAPPPVRPHGRHLVWLASFVVIAGISVGAYLFSRSSLPPLTDKDVILIADFDNRTGDDVFDDTLRQGLQIQLQQSPYLSLFADEPTRATLKLMQRQPDERITREIAREICQRRGLKAFIVGTIASVGTHYILTLQAINATSDEIIASELQEVDEKERVLSALSKAASGLREKLGESLQSVQKLDSPLELTTSSLEALKLHSMSLKSGRKRDYAQSIALLKRAIELDPSFAFAYIDLAIAYQNNGRRELMAESTLKAYELRDRVSELERLLITDSYHTSITANVDKRLEVLLLLNRLYPRDFRVLYRLAVIHEFFGDYEKAIEVARESIGTGSLSGYPVLIRSLISVNRLAEARVVVEEAFKAGAGSPQLQLLNAEIAFATGDSATFDQAIGALSDSSITQARIAVRAGRFGDAKRFFFKEIEKARGKSDTVQAARLYAELAVASATVGNCRDAVSAGTQALELTDDMVASGVSEVALAYCGERRLVEPTLLARLKKHPEATVANKVSAPIVRAALSIRDGDPARSIEELRNVPDGLSRSRWPYTVPFIRGTAFLKLSDGIAAAPEFQQIIDTPGESTFSPLYPLARLGLARAFVQIGDLARAREEYDRFFEAWKDADADLAPLIEARREYQEILARR